MPASPPARPARVTSFHALTRAFLGRFFDHDITGGADDLTLSFMWLLAFLAMPGVILPILQAWAVSWNGHGVDGGWILTAKLHGVDALRVTARADKALYLGYAAVASAAVTAISWSSLLLDRRDSLILGPMPIRPATVVMSKLAALAIYVGAVTLAMNALSSVVFGSLLATGNSIAFALRGIAAHAVASCGIGAFVVLAMAGIQSVALAVLGPRRVARASTSMQAAVAIAIAMSLFALPVVNGAMNATLFGTAGARPWLLHTPVAWFLGLYEWMLGGADPVMLNLARTAGVATAIAVIWGLVAFPLGYRRLIRDGADAGPRRHSLCDRVLVALLPRLIGFRAPVTRAIAQFLLATFIRVERHRYVLATAVGLSIAWALPAWTAHGGSTPPSADLALYAVPFSTIVFVLAGVRVALSLPSDLSGGWIFELAPPSAIQARVAVRRTVLAFAAAPVLLIVAIVDTALWGGAFAARHLLVVAPTACVLGEMLLWGMTGVPCTSPWRPERANLRAWWPLYLLAFAAWTQGIPRMGFFASRSLAATMALSLVLWLVAAALRRVSDGRIVPLPIHRDEPDVEPVSLRERATDLFRELPRWPRDAWHDTPFALRRLRAAPLFSLFAIVTLAVGIGATAAAYSGMRSLSSARLGFASADRVLAIQRYDFRGVRPAHLSWPDYEDLARSQTVFSGLSAWTMLPTSVAGNRSAEIIAVEAVSGGGFDVVGVHPAIGRAIMADDDRLDAPPVAVLSDALWRAQFGAAPGAIGASVRIGGRAFAVIGVAPASFQGVQQQNLLRASAWIPLAHAPAMFQTVGFRLDRNNRSHDWLRVLGRIRSDATEAAAVAQINGIGQQLDRGAPVTGSTRNEAARRWTAIRAVDAVNSQASPVIGFIVYVSLPALVLLVACSNLANLVLSRDVARQTELALRHALGGSRSRLIREQLIDSVVLAVIGAASGIGVARLLLGTVAGVVLRTFGAQPQYRVDASVSPAVIGAATAAACATVIIAGLAPALPLTRNVFRRALAASGMTAVPFWQGRARVITVQMAISTGLLLVAGLFMRQLVSDLHRTGHTDLGRVGLAVLPLGAQQLDEAAGRRAVERVLSTARNSAGVESLAAVSLTGRDFTTPLSVETSAPGRPFATAGRARFSDLIIASPQAFAVLGLPIRFGRGFDDRDAAGAEPVAVIGARLSRTLFGIDDSTGRQLLLKDRRSGAQGSDGVTERRIIGVTDDWDVQSSASGAATVFVPLAQDYASDLAIVARALSGDAATAAALVRQIVHDADPGVAIGFSGTAEVAANQSGRMFGLIASLAGTLAMLAVALAMAGLYGVLQHLVERRTREIGVRVALGASTREIIAMVMRDGLRPVAAGLVLGLVTATLLRLAMQPFFQRAIAAFDGAVLIMAVTPLVPAAILACYVPARRAARVSPSEALRQV
jgi:putative ABC transport system permease protein